MDASSIRQKPFTSEDRFRAIEVAMRGKSRGDWSSKVPTKIQNHLDALAGYGVKLPPKLESKLTELKGVSADPRIEQLAVRAALIAPPGIRGAGTRDHSAEGVIDSSSTLKHSLPLTASCLSARPGDFSILTTNRHGYTSDELKLDVEAILNSLKDKLGSEEGENRFYDEVLLQAENFICDHYGLEIGDMLVLHVFNVLMARHLKPKPSWENYGFCKEIGDYRAKSVGVFDHEIKLMNFFDFLEESRDKDLTRFFAEAIADGQKRFDPSFDDPVFQLGVLYFSLKSSSLKLKNPFLSKIDFQHDDLSRPIVRERMAEIAKKLKDASETELYAYLQKVYDSGCQASQFLAISTRNLVNYTPSFVVAVLKPNLARESILETLKKDKFEFVEGHDLAERDPLFKGVSPQDLQKLLIAYRKFYLDRNRAEINLAEKFSEFIRFMEDLSKKLVDLQPTDNILVDGLDQKERQSKQFYFCQKGFSLILNSRTTISKFLGEIIDCLNEAIEWNKLRTYHVWYAHDPEVNKQLLLSDGICETFIKYGNEKGKTIGRGCLITDDADKVLRSLYFRIDDRKECLSVLKKLRFEINKLNEVIDKTYLGDFVILHDAIRLKWIIPDRVEGREFNTLALRRCLDRFHGAQSLSKRVEAETVGFDLLPPIQPAIEKAIIVSSAKSEIPFSGNSFSKIFMEKFPVTSCLPKATQPYINAIHYTEVLYELLLNQGSCLDAESVAQLQMDVGFAANMALEQMITTLVIQYDLSVNGSENPVLSLYERCGHSLRSRLGLLAGLFEFLLPDSLVPVLEKAEHLELGIRDLYERGKRPSLIENTARLLHESEGVSVDDERVKCHAQGNEFIQLLIVLHSGLYFDRFEMPSVFKDHLEAIVPKGSGHSPPTSDSFLGIHSPIDTKEMFRHHDSIKSVVREALREDLIKSKPIEDNLFSLECCLRFISNFSNDSLFNFYLSRSRYILCIILEKFIFAAYQRVHSTELNDFSHKLVDLIPFGETHLNSEQITFLRMVPQIRFETRYIKKVTSTMPTGFADFQLTEEGVGLEALAESEERLDDIFGFTTILSSSNSKALRELESEIRIVDSLCTLIAEKCFPEVKLVTRI